MSLLFFILLTVDLFFTSLTRRSPFGTQNLSSLTSDLFLVFTSRMSAQVAGRPHSALGSSVLVVCHAHSAPGHAHRFSDHAREETFLPWQESILPLKETSFLRE